jgi:hypothetical protein
VGPLPHGSHVNKTTGWPTMNGFKSSMAKDSWFSSSMAKPNFSYGSMVKNGLLPP